MNYVIKQYFHLIFIFSKILHIPFGIKGCYTNSPVMESSRVLTMIKSLLSGRSFKVVVDCHVSEAYQINASIPQGSLGLTLFVLYITNLPKNILRLVRDWQPIFPLIQLPNNPMGEKLACNFQYFKNLVTFIIKLILNSHQF